MGDKKYDFAGWVTKSDILCSDGVVIKHDAFKDNDQQQVPLVWEHQHNAPTNILGHVVLHNKGNGVYGYGYFNDTPEAQSAKELVRHGDISAMSIFANKLKKQGQDVMHGLIREVSLVLAGANPGALIEEVVQHSDGEEGEAIIYTGNLIHSADDVLEEETKEMDNEENKNLEQADEAQTVGDVYETMTDEQKEAVAILVAQALEANTGDNGEETDTQNNLQQSELGANNVKQNVFDKTNSEEVTLTHSELNQVVADAISGNASSLKEELSVKHGINNIEILFPEAKALNAAPTMVIDPNTAYQHILSAVNKSPFSRIKTRTADFTTEEARANGYIKGDEKIEQFFDVLDRETTPQTIYKKQKLDRDDIIDIEDFDVVAYVNKEMRIMLEMEVARAIFISDGRAASDKNKIKVDKVRPIVSDDDFYTIKKTVAATTELVEAVIKAKKEYRGAGAPTLYISPTALADLLLMKATDGRYLFENEASLKARMGISTIMETSFLDVEGSPAAVLVNLKDYTVGASKGGQITTFDDFDIDFNQYKYLIETRLCGALTAPKSAITFTVTAEPETPKA